MVFFLHFDVVWIGIKLQGVPDDIKFLLFKVSSQKEHVGYPVLHQHKCLLPLSDRHISIEMPEFIEADVLQLDLQRHRFFFLHFEKSLAVIFDKILGFFGSENVKCLLFDFLEFGLL